MHVWEKITTRLTAAIIFTALSACATAPAPPSGGGAFAVNRNLYLCSGVAISNAPAADGYRKIVAYTPLTNVRGVTLARAPVEACVSSAYGPRRGGAGSFHEGIDLYTGSPKAVFAGGDGVVEFAGSQRGYGQTVLIRHRNGVATRYAHLSSLSGVAVKSARVRAGDILGRTGRTGNATAVHLHYEILLDGRAQNPLTVGD